MNDLVEGALRYLVRGLVEIVVEVVLHGTGWLVLRPLSRKAPGEKACIATGLAVWVILAAVSLLLYRKLS